MKKGLLFIATIVILLTAIVCTHALSSSIGNDPSADSKLDGLVLYFGCILILLIVISEIGLFSGIALLLSKHRTLLKVVFGIVIVITSLIFLIGWMRLFIFGPHIEPMVEMSLFERLPGLSV